MQSLWYAFASTLTAKAFCFFHPDPSAADRRFDVVRRLMLIASLAAFLAWPVTAAAQAPDEPLQAAAGWLQTQQQTDGGFSNGFVPGSDPTTTADAVLAIVAAGDDPSRWNAAGASPLDFLQEAVSAGLVEGPGALAKVTLAAIAAGLDPRAFGGADLVDRIRQGYSGESGLFGSGPYDSALAIQALAAASEPLPEGAIAGLLATRLEDGTFSFNGDQTVGAGDSNTTAMVVLALIAAGEADEIAPALAYFRSIQNEDGGWTYQKPSSFGEATDANSTALVLQALVAAGEDLEAWSDPIGALQALQLPSGAFRFNGADSSENLLATVQAMPALGRVTAVDAGSAGTPWGTVGLAVTAVILAAVAAWFGRRRRAEARRTSPQASP
jgi:hypothetical protein